jgi:hypothetical protein
MRAQKGGICQADQGSQPYVNNPVIVEKTFLLRS